MRRISGTEWILWYEKEKKGGYLTVVTNTMNKIRINILILRCKKDNQLTLVVF